MYRLLYSIKKKSISSTKKKNCIHCGAQLLKRAKQCFSCGSRFGHFAFGRRNCSICGHCNLARMLVCHECGHSLSDAPLAIPPPVGQYCSSRYIVLHMPSQYIILYISTYAVHITTCTSAGSLLPYYRIASNVHLDYCIARNFCGPKILRMAVKRSLLIIFL